MKEIATSIAFATFILGESPRKPTAKNRQGTGNKAKRITSPVHTPTFDIDESALKIGMGLMAWSVVG